MIVVLSKPLALHHHPDTEEVVKSNIAAKVANAWMEVNPAYAPILLSRPCKDNSLFKCFLDKNCIGTLPLCSESPYGAGLDTRWAMASTIDGLRAIEHETPHLPVVCRTFAYMYVACILPS